MTWKSRFGFENLDFGFPNKTRNPKTDLLHRNLSARWTSFKKSKVGFYGFSKFVFVLEIATRLCKQRFIILQFFASNPMENFSKPRRQTTFVQQTKGLTSKKVALHVRFNLSLHIVSPSTEKQQREMTKFWVNQDL